MSQPRLIGIKQLHKDLSRIAKEASRGQSFLVIKHTRPVFRIEPAELLRHKKYTLADLRDIQFRAKDKNLSKKVDKQVYGV